MLSDSPPLAEEPAPAAESGTVEQVAKGLFRVVVPVPFPGLDAVNGYLLAYEAGLTLVDTGANTSKAQTAWRDALSRLEADWSAVQRLVLTHAHPDHFGLAGWLQQQAQAARGEAVPVLLSAAEQDVITWFDDPRREDRMHTFLRRCGLSLSGKRTFSAEGEERMYEATRPLPEFTALRFAPLQVGPHRWKVIGTPGHADGHALLYDAERQLVLAGDHVLPRTTPNVSRWPHVAPNPLGRYLDSLDDLKQLAVERAFPGHGSPITDWQRRLEAIQVHHAERLEEAMDAVGSGTTVAAASQQLFDLSTLHPDQARFALAETLAHLECLEVRGRLRRMMGDDGVWRFETA